MKETDKYTGFLRELADFIDEHPALPQPTLYSWELKATFQLDAVEAKSALASIGEFKKNYLDTTFYATKPLGDGELQFWTSREAVCRKVVTGTRVVPEQYVAGTEGHIEPEHEEEIVEWQCDEPITAPETELDEIPF